MLKINSSLKNVFRFSKCHRHFQNEKFGTLDLGCAIEKLYLYKVRG